jgi:hypothetical protein
VSSGSFGVQKKAKIVRALDETSARTKTEAKENALSTDGDFLSRGNSQRLFEAETAPTKRLSDSRFRQRAIFLLDLQLDRVFWRRDLGNFRRGV